MANENGVVTEGGGPASIPANEGSASSDVNWSNMALEIDSDDQGDVSGDIEGDTEVLGESENSTESPVAAPVTPPSFVPETQGEAPPSPVAATPPVAAPVTAPAQIPSPPTSQEPPSSPKPDYQAWRANQLVNLEKSYVMSDETASQLMTEPELVMPKLAASVHLGVLEQVMQSVYAAMPQWVEAYTQGKSRESEAEQVFYTANPDLKDPAYRNVIFQMGKTYRQLNPSAPAGEAVKVIGNMVRSAMGVSVPSHTNPASVAAPVQAAPFIPVRGGGGNASPMPISDNPWAKLAEEFTDD